MMRDSGADPLTRRGAVAELIGLARGDDVVNAIGWVEGGGEASTFLFIDDDTLITILMESRVLPLYRWIWASRMLIGMLIVIVIRHINNNSNQT